jgi:hypothetical protein
VNGQNANGQWTAWIRRTGGEWQAVGQSLPSDEAANRRAEEVRNSPPWNACPTCQWCGLPAGVEPGAALRTPKRPPRKVDPIDTPVARKKHRRR